MPRSIQHLPSIMLLTMVISACDTAPPGRDPAPTRPAEEPIQAVSASGLRVSGGWVRAMAPNQANAAAFMTLDNTGSQDLTLTGARTAAAGAVEIHTTVRTGPTGDTLTMQRLRHLHIDASESARLAPGGHHLMLFRVAERLVAGDVLPIQLTFANHPDLLIELPVRKH